MSMMVNFLVDLYLNISSTEVFFTVIYLVSYSYRSFAAMISSIVKSVAFLFTLAMYIIFL